MTTMLAFGRQFAARISALLALGAVAATSATAQTPAVRVTQAVNDNARVTLPNGVSPVLRVAADRGAVDDSTPVEFIRIQLTRTPEQEAALDQYLAELQQKSSPNYHKWLTPDQFGARYGAAEADIAAVTSWLQSQGFTDVEVSKGRMSIGFSGTAATVRTAFHTSMHSFATSRRQFISNTSNPSIPAALAPVVAGIAHLNTIEPRPMSHPGVPGRIDPDSHRPSPLVTSVDTLSGSIHSDLTINSNNANYLYLVPGDAATIYDTPNSLNANFSTGTAYNGAGVTIGIIGAAAVVTGPIANYRSTFLGESTPNLPQITNYPTTSATDAAGEAYLDLEISGGLAPGAAQRFYTGGDGSLISQIDGAVGENAIDILSVSFGLCEQDMTTSQNKSYHDYWQQAAAQGISVTVSTGDSGSAGCDATSTTSGANVTAATGGLATSGLATTPYNIAVGGTDFQLTQSNFLTYANGSSSNSSSLLYRTAKSYIPEMVWNDSTQANGTLSGNQPWTSASSQNILAGSGGHSSCSTNTTTGTTLGTCTNGYAKPTWQRGTGSFDSDNVRDIPDVSLMAGVDFYAAWLVCTSDTVTSGGNSYTTDCSSDSSGNKHFTGFGGTSAAAPAFAGILALVQQSQGGARLGQAAINIYNIYNNSAAAATVFHDTNVGNNAVPCTSNSPNCVKNGAGYYFESGYDSGIGYDLASGLGSIDAGQLIAHWTDGSGSAAATIAVTPSATTITTANTVSLVINVTGSSDTATGTVSVSSGSYTSGPVTLTGGSATVFIPAGALAVGSNTLTVSYSGDGAYSAATNNSTVITVAAGSLTATTTALTASSTAPEYATKVTFTAAVAPAAATGTVYFFDGSRLLGSGSLSSGTASFSTEYLTLATHSITAQYLGNAVYAPSTSSALTVAVTQQNYTIAGTDVTVSQGKTGTSTITVTPSGGYTGTVTITPTASDVNINLCYTSATATVTGSAAATGSLVLDTNLNDCASSNAVGGKGAQQLFTSGKPQRFSMAKPLTFGSAAISLAGLLVGLFGLRQRRSRLFFSMLLLAGIGLAMTACGGGGDNGGGSSKTPKGTYHLTLTGTDSVGHSASNTITFVVQ